MSRTAITLLFGLAVFGAAAGVGPLPSEKARERLKERDRLWGLMQKEAQAGRLDRATELCRNVIAVEEEVFGPVHDEVVGSLQVLARLLEAKEEWEEAIGALKKVETLRLRQHGKEHWLVADARLAVGDATARSRLSAEERDEWRKAEALNRRVITLYRQHKVAEAIPLAEQALSLCKKVLGERHPSFATSLNNLASLHRDRGENKKALPLVEQALKLNKEVLGDRHPEYAANLHNLASLSKDTGEHSKALPLFEQSLKICKEALGDRHPFYAANLTSLAILHRDMGEHKKALPLAEHVMKLCKEVLGVRHPDYAASLHNLAMLHKDMGEDKKALTLFAQALKLNKEVLGERHPSYAVSLNNLAMLHQNMGEHKKALPLCEQALNLSKEVRGDRHPDYATCLHNLAMLYQNMGEHKKALPLCEQALELRKDVLGVRHPDYAATLNKLAGLHWEQGEHKQSTALSSRALDTWDGYLSDNLAAFSQRHRQEQLASLAWTLDFHLSMAREHRTAAELYAATQVFKGLTSSRAVEERLAAREPKHASMLEELRQARLRLTSHAARVPTDNKLTAWRERFAFLETDRDDLEVKLSTASDGFRKLSEKPAAEAVSKALPADAAFVEFLAYTQYVAPAKRGVTVIPERRLIAWVLRPGQAPALVSLGAIAPVEKAVARWRETALAEDSPGPDAKTAQWLRDNVWLPVSKHLGGAKLVLLAPDGDLASLPFAALPGAKAGSFLVEEHAFVHVTSGRQLLLDSTLDANAKAMLALGVFDFGKRPAGATWRQWGYLPAAEPEAKSAADLFAKAFKGENARLLLGDKATKENLLSSLAKRPAYLHLAVHGHFELLRPATEKAPPGRLDGTPVSREVYEAFERNPLLTSYLLLAGANADEDKGKLTAEEVTGLDLGGVRLAVLSACQTAEGKQVGWQGVQGLQRAFHEAGAKNLLASLWSVNDPATSVLMEEMYQNLWEKKLPPHEALRQAQLVVMKDRSRVVKRAETLWRELKEKGLDKVLLADNRGIKPKAKEPKVGVRPGKTEPSDVAWWAPWVLSGVPER